MKWTSHGGKHFPPKGVAWQKIVKSTGGGPAKYFPGVDIENLERLVFKTGTPAVNGKPWKVMEFQSIVGASDGQESRWIRVESSAGTLHGHPITHDEFNRLAGVPEKSDV